MSRRDTDHKYRPQQASGLPVWKRTLDLAIMYRPIQPPGHTVEHLFDEEFVLVTSGRAGQRKAASDFNRCFDRVGSGLRGRLLPASWHY